MKVLDSAKLRHFYNGENKVRPVVVELRELDRDHESTMPFEVAILHPETNMTTRGQVAPQFPEIFRFRELDDARVQFETYCTVLDNVEDDADEEG